MPVSSSDVSPPAPLAVAPPWAVALAPPGADVTVEGWVLSFPKDEVGGAPPCWPLLPPAAGPAADFLVVVDAVVVVAVVAVAVSCAVVEAFVRRCVRMRDWIVTAAACWAAVSFSSWVWDGGKKRRHARAAKETMRTWLDLTLGTAVQSYVSCDILSRFGALPGVRTTLQPTHQSTGETQQVAAQRNRMILAPQVNIKV